jgi:CIC family chloride channel protein
MGAVVGGATGAAMAAIVMIFEMTLDYTVIVPLTLAVAISYGVRRSLITDSIYTRKLTLRGESVPETMRADIQLSRCAANIMHPVSPEAAAGFVIANPDGSPKEYVTVREVASVWDVVVKMRANDASAALVTSTDGEFAPADVIGVITRKDIMDALADDMELFG